MSLPTIRRRSDLAQRLDYAEQSPTLHVTWDDKTLDAFITGTEKSIPGNVMPFRGVADAKQRTEIIDYLNSVK